MNGLELLALMQARGVPERWDHPTAWAGALATSPLFTGVSTRRLRKLARDATSAEFAPGETIIFAGNRGNFLYVILGDVKAVSAAASRMLGTGDYFGEVAMIDGGPRPAIANAVPTFRERPSERGSSQRLPSFDSCERLEPRERPVVGGCKGDDARAAARGACRRGRPTSFLLRIRRTETLCLAHSSSSQQTALNPRSSLTSVGACRTSSTSSSRTNHDY